MAMFLPDYLPGSYKAVYSAHCLNLILASTIYKMTTWSNRYELSATLSVISFLIVGTLTLVNLHMSGAFKEVD